MRAVAMDFYASALMFAVRGRRGLASMSEIEAVSLNWSDLGMSELLPTGTVTLLLADVEGSTRLWETQPDELTAAFAKLDHTLVRVVDAHHGVRPIEQVRAIASSSPSAGPATQWRAHWRCSCHRWHPFGCASACTPERFSCAMKPTTSARPLTGPPGCAIWRTADRRCYRAPQAIWSPIGCPPMRG